MCAKIKQSSNDNGHHYVLSCKNKQTKRGFHFFYKLISTLTPNHHHHHHQPINVPTAGAQAFLMDYPQGERAITHHAGPVRIGGC
jgi:hypothetical protein